MNSKVLSGSVQFLFPIILLFSIFLLFRGHNYPGGGFIAGIAASAGFVLLFLAKGVESARRKLRFNPLSVAGVGLLISFVSGLIGLLYGKEYLTGVWSYDSIPVLGKVGSPALFDLGVYFVVIGVSCAILFSIADNLNNAGGAE